MTNQTEQGAALLYAPGFTLLPCPFCGGNAVKVGNEGHRPGCYFLVRAEFDAQLERLDLSGAPAVLAAWNSRITVVDPAPEGYTAVRRMVATGSYAEGDYVTRGGDDVHQCTNLNEAGDCADFVCIVAPTSGWASVGEVEHNLTRRYTRTDWKPQPPNSAPQAQVVAQPDGRLHADGYFTWNKGKRPAYIADRGLPCDFYLAPPAARAEPLPSLARWSQHG